MLPTIHCLLSTPFYLLPPSYYLLPACTTSPGHILPQSNNHNTKSQCSQIQRSSFSPQLTLVDSTGTFCVLELCFQVIVTMPWQATPSDSKYGIAICSYAGISEYCLPLSVGDRVQLVEMNG
eukprot:gene5594-7234_t